MAWHQCFNEFGHKRDYTRTLLPVLDMWKEEADICDEDVPLAGGGTEKRYECNGFDTTEKIRRLARTPSCIPAGDFDHYAVPRNQSGVAGPTSGPITVTIV